MAYNVTQKSKETAAAKDTATKMKQESKISTALNSGYFLPVANEFEKAYGETGAVPDLTLHNMNLTDILTEQYSNTASKFNSQARDSLGEPENAEEINDQVNTAVKMQQNKDIFISSQSIAQTTHRSLHEAVNKVVVAATVAGVFLTNKKVAKKAKAEFKSNSKERLPGISITQTQQSAEGAKYAEMNTLDRNNAIFPRVTPQVSMAKTTIKKTWIAILDGRTRTAHAAADGQTVAFDEPYTVGGQKLKYPSDTSLGATVSNTINCRCSSVKSIKRKN